MTPSVSLILRIIRFLGYYPYTPALSTSEKLKMWRQSLGFSQASMAEALGIDEDTWRRWEIAQGEPNLDYFGRIKSFLDSLERVIS